MQKLREEKRQYIEFQRVERELEHYKKIYIAWKYVQALKNSEKAESDVKSTLNKIEKYKQTIKNGKEESAKIDDMITEIVEKRDLVQKLLLSFFINYFLLYHFITINIFNRKPEAKWKRLKAN